MKTTLEKAGKLKRERAYAFVDGEAIKIQKGSDTRSVYYLLAGLNGRGDYQKVQNLDGLSTAECLNFIVNLEASDVFLYAGRYDSSNWLKDLSFDQFKVLKSIHTVKFQHQRQLYFLTYIGDYSLSIIYYEGKGIKPRRVQCWDLFRFCQTSFVGALKAWNIPVPCGMEAMKESRDRFTIDDLAAIEEYNKTELYALKSLFEEHRQAFGEADIAMRDWYSPASALKSIMRKRKTNIHISPISLPKRNDYWEAMIPISRHKQSWKASPITAVKMAYYGGRFEASRLGRIGDCYEHDLTSAYPSAIVKGLPSFREGEWVKADEKGKRLSQTKWSVAFVKWQPRKKDALPLWGPFPQQSPAGILWYPVRGQGWYHKEEIEAAQRCLSHEYIFAICDIWEWEPRYLIDPFPWVKELLEECSALKKKMKKNPDLKGKRTALKLSLNSLYGTLASVLGTGDDYTKASDLFSEDPVRWGKAIPHTREGKVSKMIRGARVPTWYNPYWAGLITARTRLMLLKAIKAAKDSNIEIIYLATDGVHARGILPLPKENWVKWEIEPHTDMVVLGCGLYATTNLENKRIVKCRGLPKGRISFQDMETYAGIIGRDGYVRIPRVTFVSWKAAFSREHRDEVRFREILNTWEDIEIIFSGGMEKRRRPLPGGLWGAPDLDMKKDFDEFSMFLRATPYDLGKEDLQ